MNFLRRGPRVDEIREINGVGLEMKSEGKGEKVSIR